MRYAASDKRGNYWTFAPLAIFALMAAIFAFALQSGDPSRLPSALRGKPVPATSFDPIDGLLAHGVPVPGFKSTELGNGQISIVNFWASWCAPCIQEHPLLIELAKRTGVEVYGVNYKDSPVGARRFLGLHGNPFRAVGVDPAGRNAIEWGVYGMPETFVINGKGEIAFKLPGPIDERSLVEEMIPEIEKARNAYNGKNSPRE
ncbi:MAG: DsbE family thiol:disulfide interchange protein [Candidatus Binataceae bacterium]